MTAQQPYLSNDLPETTGEMLPVAHNQVPMQSGAPERQPLSSELPTAQAGVAPQVQAPTAQPVVPLVSQVQVPGAPASGSQGSPPVADDVDLIEKEWVQRAKALVAKTKDDPHTQNKEMNKFKADYIKKRYNKEIKVSEG